MDWKEKVRDLSTSLNNFGSLKSLQRGGGALKRPAPLCRFFSLPKFFEHLLKVSYFFLSIHFGLQGLPKITFWGPWTYSKMNSPCKLRNLVALRGQKSKKNRYLRIQGRMQFFRFFIVFRVFECLIDELLAIWSIQKLVQMCGNFWIDQI